MPRLRALTACASVIASFASFALLGCAGWRDHGDTYYSRSSDNRTASFSFGLPGDPWRPVDDVDGVQVAWVNPRLDGVGLIELHVQCADQGDSSLEQYTDHLRIDWSGWKVIEQQEAQLADRAALRSVVDGELDGIVRRNEFWVVKKNGCLFDLRYSAGPGDFAAGQPAFAAVVGGFQFPR